MKGRPLIFIFLFLISLQTVFAESHTGEVDLQLSLDAPDFQLSNGTTWGVGSISIYEFNYKGAADAGYPIQIVYRDATMDKQAAYNWEDIPQNVGGSFALYDNGVFAGSGGITIHRVNDVDEKRVDIWYQFDDTDFIMNESETSMEVTLYASPISEYYNQFNLQQNSFSYATQNVEFRLKSGSYYGVHPEWDPEVGVVEYSYRGNFINEYNITLSGATAITNITRDGLGQDLSSSRLKLTNSTGSIVYLSAGYTTSNTSYGHNNGSYYYYLDVENYGDVLIYDGVYTGTGEQDGSINLNQSFYTDPEDIEIDWEIDDFDSGSYNYKFQMTATLDNNVDSNFWEAVGNWNKSTYVSSASGTALFDLSSGWYDDLPIWIRGELWVQDKGTGTWTKLDNTPAVIYHESAVQGQIWTDKSNYNVTELVEISYTTNVAENYIAVEEPYSLWSTHDVPVGTYSFMYELSTSAVGNTTIYLFENSELVDLVTISVSSESGDDAYAAWMKDYYFEGETASFYYYSSNASAQITVYDGADIIVFGPATTQLGYHNGRVNTANTNPGTFLLSLYHNGTYYNDTMIFESADSWVRFDSSKYYVGDTINIEYYLADPTHQISMWDANVNKVVRFTKDFGLVSGSMQILPYTLSEGNEYSHDIPGRLASGELTLGFWTVFIEEREGVLGDSWDEAYVCYATDDDGSYGTDTSNEMISIFFSPEGAFMLYTVCLTMMGLVLAKHPAGGGAGATVGVGFGVYFNVLPPWMLMLTVILLVVLGGVSVAAYYRGK